jgi:plastocyanin
MKLLLNTLACAALVAATLAAQAGTVTVVVTDKDGKPAPDVVVLIDPAQKVALKPSVAPVTIAQQDLRFVPFLTVVPAGTTVRFVNRDSYDHHVRSTPSGPLGAIPAASTIELRLDAAEAAAPPARDEYSSGSSRRTKKSGQNSADVALPNPGPIGLACHIHGSMRGQIYVAATPWHGKTDANGMLVLDGVPDGAAELTLWHADQLTPQVPVQLQVTAPALRADAQLNFTPRRRRN